MFPLTLIKQALIYILNYDGSSDQTFIRSCNQIVEANPLPENAMSSLFKNLITELKTQIPLEEALAAVMSVDFMAVELIDNLKTLEITPSEIATLKAIVNETTSTIAITNNVKKIQDVTTKILNKELTTSTQIKSEFKNIMSQLFDVMVTLDKSTVDEEIEISPDNIDQIIDHMTEYLSSNKIILPSGLEWLDKYLQGGFHNSRLYTLVMKSGDGKSTVMLSLAQKIQQMVTKGTPVYDMLVESLKQKDTVVDLEPTIYYFTFENSIDETLERYLPVLAGGSVGTLEDFKGRIGSIKDGLSKYDIKLKIKYKGGFTTSPLDVIQYLEKEKLKGRYPVMVISDYLGIMVSGDGSQEKRHQLEKITAGLKNIAVMYNCPVMTGVQVKKDSFDKSELKESDIKESSGIIDNSDVIIGAWQGETLHQTYIKEMWMKILKQRNFVKNVTFKTGVDFTTFQLFNLEQQNNPQTFNNQQTENTVYNTMQQPTINQDSSPSLGGNPGVSALLM